MKKKGYKSVSEAKGARIKTPQMKDKALRIKVTDEVFLEDIPKPEHILVKKPRLEYKKSTHLDLASDRAKVEKYEKKPS